MATQGLILITGATGALGQALAKTLDQQGAELVLLGRSLPKLIALSAQLARPALLLEADLSDPSSVSALKDKLPKPVTGFAHCVGSSLIRPLHLTQDADLAEVMAKNFFTAFYSLRWLVAQALQHKQGLSAVLVGSTVGMAGFPNHEAIAAAKAAVAALAQSTAATYANKGIRVNTVMPGLMRSPLTQRLLTTPEAEARMAAMNPMHQIGEPEDVAGLMAFLLSDAARWITGQVIGVDGGHAVLHPLPQA